MEWERGKAETRSWKVSVGEMVGEEGGTPERRRETTYAYEKEKERKRGQRDRRGES